MLHQRTCFPAGCLARPGVGWPQPAVPSLYSLLLPTDGDALLVYRGLTVTLLPKLTVFALWDAIADVVPIGSPFLAGVPA